MDKERNQKWKKVNHNSYNNYDFFLDNSTTFFEIFFSTIVPFVLIKLAERWGSMELWSAKEGEAQIAQGENEGGVTQEQFRIDNFNTRIIL
jgi:hypothetical protein